MIDGRGLQPGLDPAVQNLGSGIAFTMIGVTFFRNFALWYGALCMVDPWPFVGVVQSCTYAHNEGLFGQHDMVFWQSVRSPPRAIQPEANRAAVLGGRWNPRRVLHANADRHALRRGICKRRDLSLHELQLVVCILDPGGLTRRSLDPCDATMCVGRQCCVRGCGLRCGELAVGARQARAQYDFSQLLLSR